MDGTTSLKKNQYNLKTHIMMKITINKPTEFEAVYLKVDAGVRYWEDARVNGIRDIDLHENKGIGKPLMPCAVQIKEEPDYNIYSDHYRWRPIIAIETGRIINWMQGITADVHYKVCDDFICDIVDEDDIAIASYDGYVPKIMCPAEDGYGDYIIMNIDENGFIKGWNKELIKKLIKEEED